MASIRKRVWTSGGVEKAAWYCDYVDGARKRHRKTFRTKRQAEAWRIQAGHEIATGTHTPASQSITVAEACELWIKHCVAEGLERGSIRPRRNHVELAIRPLIGHRKLAELTGPMIHQFLDQLRDSGRSRAMRKAILTSLKAALRFARERGHVAQNVADGIKVKDDERRDSKKMQAGVDFPTLAEIRLLMDKAPARWRAFVVTAVYTGARASELRGLRWQDVDLEGAAININQRADDWGQMGPPKSKAGRRRIPLTPMVVNALRQWRPACPKGDLVFPTRRGTVMSHQNLLHRFFYPHQVACGIVDDSGGARYGLHAMRHAAATAFIAHLGWTPKKLQAVMGHSSIQMTFDLYGHLFDDHEADREDMKKLEAAVAAA